jgi:LacI family transcriptional regulator, sucrose operon repressor
MTTTIEQIAKMAGVSKTTVSLVINKKSKTGRISRDTEKRVLEIVRRTGYSPNMLARGFRLSRSRTLGLVVPDLRIPFFAELNHEIEGIARAHGYQILDSCSNDDKAIELEVVNNLLAYSIEGLIVASVMSEKQLLARTYNRKAPVVFIDREIALKNISSVASDNYGGAYDAVRILISGGVREIAFIGGLPDLSTSRNRFLGYRTALADAGLQLDHSLTFQEDYMPAGGYRMIGKAFEKIGRMPEAVFTASYTLLEGVLQFVQDKLGRIPPDLRIATFDDHPLLDYLPCRIVSVRQDCNALAAGAFELLEASFRKPARARHVRVAPKLIVRT